MKTSNSLELLETRIAPAALFNASVNADGILKVVPYASWATDIITDTFFHVQQTAAREFDISDGSETVHVTGVKRINVALKGDNDTVIFNFLPKSEGGFRGIVSAATGIGRDAVFLDGGHLAGRFSGNGGSPAEGDPVFPTINSSFGINDLMTVTNSVTWSGPGAVAFIDGSTRTVTINGALAVFSNAGKVASDLTIKGYSPAGDGETPPPIFDLRTDLHGSYGGLNITGTGGNEFLVIGGNVREKATVSTLLGNDLVSLEGRITGNATVRLGDGDNLLGMRGNQIFGYLKVFGGTQRDDFLTDAAIPGGPFPSPDGAPEVYGKVTLNMGGGANMAAIVSGNLYGGITYVGGADVDFVRIGPDTFGPVPGTVHGVIDISAGDGENIVRIDTWSNVHTLEYRGGEGLDIVAIHRPGDGLLEGRVLLGAGDDAFGISFFSDAIYDIALTVDGGGGVDSAFFVAGALDPVTGFVTTAGPGHYQIGGFIDILAEIALDEPLP